MTAKKKTIVEPVPNCPPVEGEVQQMGMREEEPYHPLAVPEPTPLERLEAVELQMKVMKNWINKHNRMHYGRDAL